MHIFQVEGEVGSRMASRTASGPNPQDCKYDNTLTNMLFYGKRDIPVRRVSMVDLQIGRVSQIIWLSPMESHEPLKAKEEGRGGTEIDEAHKGSSGLCSFDSEGESPEQEVNSSSP